MSNQNEKHINNINNFNELASYFQNKGYKQIDMWTESDCLNLTFYVVHYGTRVHLTLDKNSITKNSSALIETTMHEKTYNCQSESDCIVAKNIGWTSFYRKVDKMVQETLNDLRTQVRKEC
jgi:hypothetical protein|tara:strand:- start:1600 stop:1962 length:363 start_codon:yes stop_codon:yes gene_type:complete